MNMTPIKSEFWIDCKEYNHYSDKALDYLIKSWKVKGIEKEICMLKRKLYKKEAKKYLKRILKITKTWQN